MINIEEYAKEIRHVAATWAVSHSSEQFNRYVYEVALDLLQKAREDMRRKCIIKVQSLSPHCENHFCDFDEAWGQAIEAIRNIGETSSVAGEVLTDKAKKAATSASEKVPLTKPITSGQSKEGRVGNV